MKKLVKLTIVSLILVVAIAAPKNVTSSSLTSCLWELVGGRTQTIAQDVNGNPLLSIDQNGWVQAGGQYAAFFAQWPDGSFIDLEPTYFNVTGPTGRGALFQPNAGAGGTPYDFDTEIEHTSGGLFVLGNNGTSRFAVYYDGSIVTGNGNRWILGDVVQAPVQVVTNKYVQVEIGGQLVKLAVVE